MYREAGMSKSQRKSATRANRSPSGRPEVKRLPDRRGYVAFATRPYAQDLTTKGKIPKARSERAPYN